MFHYTNFLALFAAIVATLLFGDKAQAAIITQTVNVTPGVIGSIHISQSDGDGQDFSTPVTWSFNRFNPALGQLTGVQFDVSLNFLLEASNVGGNDAISAATSGLLIINNTAVTSGGFLSYVGFDGNGFTHPPESYVVRPNFGTINADGPFTPFSGSGSYNVLYNGTTSIGAPFSEYDLTASLQSGSYSSVTYTYTPTAVPEPSSLALLAVAGAGFVGTTVRRRLRK